MFVGLTNGFGMVTITRVVRHLETDTEFVRDSAPLRFADRLREVAHIVRLRNIEFPTAGTYEFALYADNEPLTRYTLRVVGP